MTDSNPDADVEPGDEPPAPDDVDAAEEPAAEDGPARPDPAHDDLIARVAAHDEALAGAVAELSIRVATLEAQVAEQSAVNEELEAKLKRARADFQNYKKRVKDRQAEIRSRATEALVERLLDVRDNLVRALEQDEETDIRDGVEATLASFDRVLADEDVSAIEPAPGQEVDPERHEVVLREEDADQPAGTIERIYRPGYELAGSVLRPAQVTVSEPDAEE